MLILCGCNIKGFKCIPNERRFEQVNDEYKSIVYLGLSFFWKWSFIVRKQEMLISANFVWV